MRAPSPSPLILLAAVAGCYRSSGAPPEQPAAPAPPPPAGPAPRLAWVHDTAWVASRMPAVSADGAVVLIPISDKDGARGNANYRFERRDRRDAKLAGHVVLAADQADALFDADGATPELGRRIAAANRWLEAQHARHRFAQLWSLEVEPGDELASSFRATGDGVTIEWRPSRVTIAHGGRTVVDRPTPASWLAPTRPRAAGLPPCENPAYLAGAAVSLPHRIALLRIAYGGTDTCWEPDDQLHVVAW